MTYTRSYTAGLLLAVCGLLLHACSVPKTITYDEVDIETAQTEVPAYALLDVGIVIFNPNVPEGVEQQQKDFVFPEVRRAEARYMPFHLKNTLERTGYWGSVWVLPERSEAVDLLVWGRIDQSDGYRVALRIGAWDASGREWLNKNYTQETPAKAYADYRDSGQDPYQSLYNEIANDLLEARKKMSAAELTEIREIAQLRYAADLVPTAFGNYLEQDKKGIYEISRLPAADDPMVGRLAAVREREYMLVDTLNEYYAGLYYDLAVPYEDWREMSREEAIRYDELKRSARMRQLLGAAAIIGAIAYEGGGGGNSAITNVAILGGIEGLRSGFGLSTEANMHKESMRELGESFDSEVEPLVVEVEGQTRRLTGTAEEKYREWRKILHEIYSAETGGVMDAELVPPASADAGVGRLPD